MRRFLCTSIALLALAAPLYAQTYEVVRNFQNLAAGLGAPGAIAQSRGGAMFATGWHSAYRMTTSGSNHILHNFPLNVSIPDTSTTFSGLTLGTDGQFYGADADSGSSRQGAIFKMSVTGVVTVLENFSTNGFPMAAPIQSVGGDFYGSTTGNVESGTGPYGSIYRIAKNGAFTLLHTFTGSDGGNPQGLLVQGDDFYIYGTTEVGGLYNKGTVFRISTTGGNFQVLHSFDDTHGKFPLVGLVKAGGGNFYGVTAEGGLLDSGVLFRITSSGAFTVLHKFNGFNEGGTAYGAMVLGSDGNLYGTNISGGKNGYGVVFRASLSGHVTALHDFDQPTGSFAYGTLAQHTNGKFYGTTTMGGKTGYGVFFSLDAGLPPFVTYLPTYGRAGALVQILGQGFTASSQVYFNGRLAAPPIVVSPTYLRVVVPSGATTGPITVTTAAGKLTSNKVFIVHP